MIRRLGLLAAFAVILAGCGAGDVSEADAQSKDRQIKEATEKLNGKQQPKREPGQQGD